MQKLKFSTETGHKLNMESLKVKGCGCQGWLGGNIKPFSDILSTAVEVGKKTEAMV